jgi:glycosyltransferase involved in cell wall biosynthesis
MKVDILSNKIPWFGKYSGYECLPNYFADDVQASIYYAKPSLINKIIGKIYQLNNKWNTIKPEDIHSGMQFLSKLNNNEISHILYLEVHNHLLTKIRRSDKGLVGTIHLPISQWTNDNLKLLEKLPNAILLYEQEKEKFGNYIDLDRIHVIKHGVDIDFFKPCTQLEVNKNKVLFVGHYLRNFDMMLNVYNILTKDISDEIEFHFIIPQIWYENIHVLQRLSSKKNIFFHEKLSDEELLQQYQTSNVLLMPMEDSGANTAIVQAIATGLPIITTDVGGIRSYGGGEIFPIVSNNADLAMADLFHKFFSDPEYRRIISKKQRDYATSNLDWNIIAKKHLSLYASLKEGS